MNGDKVCGHRNCPDYSTCERMFYDVNLDICTKREKENGMGYLVPGRIDVIIPTYNCCEYLASAIESIASQTYPKEDIHVIIIDDGSTDGTNEKLKELKKKYHGKLVLDCVRRKKNRGANYSRNEGLAMGSGEFVFFMDADSVLDKKLLERLKRVLDFGAADEGYAYCDMNRVWVAQGQTEVWCPGEFHAARLKQNNYISFMSLVRRELIPDEGLDVNISRLQDWDLWLTLLEKGIKGCYLDLVLMTVFIRKDGMSSSMDGYEESRLAVLKKHGLL